MGIYSNIDELQDNIIEEISEIIAEADATPDPIYADIAHRPDNNLYNDVNTTDDGYFLIVDGWESVGAIGRALIERNPFIADEPRCDVAECDDNLMFGPVLDLFLEWRWGFADEYFRCGSCGAPMPYEKMEFIIEDGECTCFDCLDDEYYLEEYLPYTPAIRDELAAQEIGSPRFNLKFTDGDLRDAGYEPYKEDQLAGLYEGWKDDPLTTVENAPEGYTYIFNYSSASAPYNPFGVEYEIWRRMV